MQAQGIGTACNLSTATYPSTATGTGKILRADGTNWVPSTATYPNTAGTSGNVLTSDGTNWVSSAPSGGGVVNGYLSTTIGNPADSTTYYFVQGDQFTSFTTSTSLMSRFYAVNSFTLTKVYGAVRINTTLGSAQNCTLFIRVNDTTNTNITTTLQLTATENTFNNTALSLSLNAGDFFVFGFTGPAWTTNPTNVAISLAWSS